MPCEKKFVFIYSQKKYKQLYDSLTKNSSIYESQEIAITICDDEPESNGTVENQVTLFSKIKWNLALRNLTLIFRIKCLAL